MTLLLDSATSHARFFAGVRHYHVDYPLVSTMRQPARHTNSTSRSQMENKSPAQALSSTRDCPSCSPLKIWEPNFQPSLGRCPRCQREAGEDSQYTTAMPHHFIRPTSTGAAHWSQPQGENLEHYDWGDNPSYQIEDQEKSLSAPRMNLEKDAASFGSSPTRPSCAVTGSPENRPPSRPSVESEDRATRVRKRRRMWLVGPCVTPGGKVANSIARVTVSDQTFTSPDRHR
ncbi:hypothetical protein RB597_002730 [Gaeumannomyces tritici]